MVSSVTESAEGKRCRWCGRRLAIRPGPGRPRVFCGQSCRQKEYISRLRAKDAGLAESELIVTRAELDDLRDKLYVLECALDDARRDLDEGDDPARALRWVVESAEPLLGTTLGEDRGT